MSVKAMVLAGISAVAAVGAVVVLVVIIAGSSLVNLPGDSQNGDAFTSDGGPSQSPKGPGSLDGPGDPDGPGQNDIPAFDPAYGLIDVVAALPDEAAVEVLWEYLAGYWTAADNQFVGFIFDGGKTAIQFGYFETEYGPIGNVVNAQPTGDYTAILTIYVPAAAESEFSAARDELWVDVYIDVSDYHVDGKIKIRIESQASGDWYQYYKSGNSLQEAYENIH